MDVRHESKIKSRKFYATRLLVILSCSSALKSKSTKNNYDVINFIDRQYNFLSAASTDGSIVEILEVKFNLRNNTSKPIEGMFNLTGIYQDPLAKDWAFQSSSGLYIAFIGEEYRRLYYGERFSLEPYSNNSYACNIHQPQDRPQINSIIYYIYTLEGKFIDVKGIRDIDKIANYQEKSKS